MVKDYNKYINSTGTHWISNSGGDERGKISGGAAGDQTGKEWQLRSWYMHRYKWSCVLRYPNPEARLLFANLSCAAALNDMDGYDQLQRRTYHTELRKAGWNPEEIRTPCEADCTAGVAANWIAVGNLLGIDALKNLDPNIYSGNMRSRFKAAGFDVLTDARFLNGPEYLLPGDVLLSEGHHATANVTLGKNAVEDCVIHAPGERTLRNGMGGDDVQELQTHLIQLGYDCGRWGADGDFGDATEAAVRAFQKDKGLTVDGIAGPKTLAALMAALGEPEDSTNGMVEIRGGQCYVRSAPNTSGAILGVARNGEKLVFGGLTADNGWLLVEYKNENGWVSGKYGKLVD